MRDLKIKSFEISEMEVEDFWGITNNFQNIAREENIDLYFVTKEKYINDYNELRTYLSKTEANRLCLKCLLILIHQIKHN